MKRLITVGREFSSGGRELGRRLAEELGIEYYDKEIVTAIANHTSLSEEYVRQVVEKTPHRLYPITVGQSMSYVENYYFRQVQSVYEAQSEIITGLAEKSDCVIVGRCADFILREKKPYRLFVYASIESRIQRYLARSEEPGTEREIKKKILSIDKNRQKYYDYYTDQKWGQREFYDLMINTTDTVIKEIVPTLAKLFE